MTGAQERDGFARKYGDAWREVAQQGTVTGPQVIFESVGASLVQGIVEQCDSGARIFAAGAGMAPILCRAATRPIRA